MVRLRSVATSFFVLPFLLASTAFAQDKPGELKVAITTFIADPAARLPNEAAQMIADTINAKGGIGGVPIKLSFVEEGVNRAALAASYRRSVEEDKVDVTFAAVTSDSCNTLAPIAEELKVINLMWDCGASSTLEGRKYRYNFRTQANGTQEMLAIALYLLKQKPNLRTLAVLNQEGAWGRESWALFSTALKRLKPDVRIVSESFTKFGQVDYTDELKKIEADRPDVVFTTSAAGDLYTLLRQVNRSGLAAQSTFVAAVGESAIQQLGLELPEGVIIGARGDHWFLHPEMISKPEFKAFNEDFRARTGAWPNYLVYHMAQAFAALQTGYSKALAANGGRWPSKEQVVDALSGISFQAWGRPVRMRPEDNQGVEAQLVGVTRQSSGHNSRILDDMMIFDGEKLIAPPGQKSQEWLNSITPDLLQLDAPLYRSVR